MDNNQKALSHFGVPGMRWGQRRLTRAVSANKRDASDLRKHGMTKEAEAVEKVGQKLQGKLDKKISKQAARENYIKIEKTARKEYESVVGKTRLKTGKEFADTFSGVTAAIGILASAAALTKMATGKNYVANIFRAVGG